MSNWKSRNARFAGNAEPNYLDIKQCFDALWDDLGVTGAVEVLPDLTGQLMVQAGAGWIDTSGKPHSIVTMERLSASGADIRFVIMRVLHKLYHEVDRAHTTHPRAD